MVLNVRKELQTMGRQHPPKIKINEPKKQEYPSIGRMSPKQTIDENAHENYHDNPRKNKPKHLK